MYFISINPTVTYAFLQGGAPWLAKLVQITLYGRYIYTIPMVYKPINMTGWAPPTVFF